jgi:hypothetical protein
VWRYDIQLGYETRKGQITVEASEVQGSRGRTGPPGLILKAEGLPCFLQQGSGQQRRLKIWPFESAPLIFKMGKY